MATELYVCNRCGHRFNLDDAESKMVFAGSLEEPPEYQDLCLACHSDDLEIVWDDEE